MSSLESCIRILFILELVLDIVDMYPCLYKYYNYVDIIYEASQTEISRMSQLALLTFPFGRSWTESASE